MAGSTDGIGARVTRREDKRFITGKGRYTDDMQVPGMMHAGFSVALLWNPEGRENYQTVTYDAARVLDISKLIVAGYSSGAQMASCA